MGVVTYSPAVADAAQLVLTARLGDVHVSLALPASDMLWPNVSIPKDEVDERPGAANVGPFFRRCSGRLWSLPCKPR